MIIAIKRKPTHHSLHWDGCGSTGSPPKEIPADLKVKVETLHNSVQVLFVSKQIPWIIQAQMAEDGYVTMEDLACRWVSAEKGREEGPKDLKFRDGENGFDKAISDFSATRLYQAVLQARSLIHSGKTPSLSEGVARPTTGPSVIELHWRRIGPSRLASHAWRQIYQLMADGSTLKNAMKTIREDQLFWTREVYERVLFQQLRTPKDPKGKGKGKDKGKKGGKTKGVHQEHLKTNPGKGNG